MKITYRSSIVFIHGLNGHPVNSWTYIEEVWDSKRAEFHTRQPQKSKNTKNSNNTRPYSVYWPLDLLPISFPHARVFTFGYEGDFYEIFSETQRLRAVSDNALQLLIQLESERKENSSRQLVFVTQEFGGVVAAEALRLSNQQHRFRLIHDSFRGIVFFGFPFAQVTEVNSHVVSYDEQTSDQEIRSTFVDWIQKLERYFWKIARERDWKIQAFCIENVTPKKVRISF